MSVKKVVIAGGSGLVGNRLTDILLEKGYRVTWLSRNADKSSRVEVYGWDVRNGEIQEGALEGAHAVLNLAGAGIADSRWTDRRKKLITGSRVNTTELLGRTMEGMQDGPKVFIGASAIGFYGDRGNDWMTEKSDAGASGFLPESVQAIEKAIEEYIPDSVRTVVPRFGIVLSRHGGALPKLLFPLNFGIASQLGPGSQYMSWVHIDDVCRFLVRAIEDDSIKGRFNITAPNPMPQKEFARKLRELWNPLSLVIPVPSFALRILFGEMADSVLDSTRVRPERLMDAGFEFQYPDLDIAFKDLKSRKV